MLILTLVFILPAAAAAAGLVRQPSLRPPKSNVPEGSAGYKLLAAAAGVVAPTKARLSL